MTKKPTHGGARKGAGRKPKPEGAKITTSMRLSQRILDYYRENGISMADEFEAFTERSKGFKAWLKSRD